MNTLTGSSTRTITGYLVTLLEYPRWLIARDVDFTDCHLHGAYEADDETCKRCEFGDACRWLNRYRDKPTVDTPLPDLVGALHAAAGYIRRAHASIHPHGRGCDCDTCQWLHEASNFLRSHRHRA